MGPDAGTIVYKLLREQQNRGQEAAGIVGIVEGETVSLKGHGLVPAAIKELGMLRDMTVAIGHVRYSTSGASKAGDRLSEAMLRREIQPMVIYPVAIAFNGNIANFGRLAESVPPMLTNTDTEFIARFLAGAVESGSGMASAVSSLFKQIDGACSLVVLNDGTVTVARDNNGYKPLVIGTVGSTVVAASESSAITKIGGRVSADLDPGEVVTIRDDGRISTSRGRDAYKETICLLEFLYLSKASTKIRDTRVRVARHRIGRSLARRHDGVAADIVVPIPNSAIAFAKGYAEQSKIPFVMGLERVRDTRSFIHPNADERVEIVKGKLRVVREFVEGQRVVLIDDSIIRGNTLTVVVAAMREAGATEVHVRIGSPPVKHPCFMGVDFPTSEELIAHTHTTESMAAAVGADSLEYARLEEVLKAMRRTDLCTACFSGEYPLREETLHDLGLMARA